MQYKDINGLLESFATWQVYLLHGKIETPQPHYQVILNKDFINTWNLIYLSIATSQIENNEKFIRNRILPLETLVIVANWEIPFFSKRTCFNCNTISQCDIFSIYTEYLKNKFKYIWNLPQNILNKIYEWIKLSPLVDIRKKRLIGIV